jgi:hypothetical protein
MDPQASATNQNQLLAQMTDMQHRLFDERRLRVPAATLADYALDLYLGACVLQARYLHTQRSPTEHGWQTTAWDFGRFAKAHPALISLDSGQALAIVRRLLNTNFWQSSLGMTTADAEMAFDHVWNDCWSIPGYDPLTAAHLKAREHQGPADPHQPRGYDTFLAVLRFLQQDAGNAPILLPCHKLADLLQCLPMTVSRYRTKALREGYLQLIKEHRFRPNAKGEATEFRYIPPPAAPAR